MSNMYIISVPILYLLPSFTPLSSLCWSPFSLQSSHPSITDTHWALISLQLVKLTSPKWFVPLHPITFCHTTYLHSFLGLSMRDCPFSLLYQYLPSFFHPLPHSLQSSLCYSYLSSSSVGWGLPQLTLIVILSSMSLVMTCIPSLYFWNLSHCSLPQGFFSTLIPSCHFGLYPAWGPCLVSIGSLDPHYLVSSLFTMFPFCPHSCYFHCETSILWTHLTTNKSIYKQFF